MRPSGFPAVANADARVLILGSLPGQRSIDAGEYYAHPGNAFWRIVDDLFDIPRTLPYGVRTRRLAQRGVALWDVLQSSQRRGSLDAAIDSSTATVNDFGAFFKAHARIHRLCFNGRKAAELFRRLALPLLSDAAPDALVLPSTSPAHAAMPYAEKLRQWTPVRNAANEG